MIAVDVYESARTIDVMGSSSNRVRGRLGSGSPGPVFSCAKGKKKGTPGMQWVKIGEKFVNAAMIAGFIVSKEMTETGKADLKLDESEGRPS